MCLSAAKYEASCNRKELSVQRANTTMFTGFEAREKSAPANSVVDIKRLLSQWRLINPAANSKSFALNQECAPKY